MAKRFKLELWQDGIQVAGVDAPDAESARREIMHYAMQYAQDGPVEIRGKDAGEIMAFFKDDPPLSGREKTTLNQLKASLA